MVMGGNGGDAAAWGGGFAARASRCGTDGDGPAAGGGVGRPGFGAPRGGVQATASMPAVAGDRVKPAATAGPRKGDAARVKRLATIVAVSVALAAVSVSYGVWSAAASRSAVEHATAGALPTLVAAAGIRAGDALTAESVEVQDVPASYRASSALGAEALGAEGGLSGGRALVDIPAGAQLSSSLVTGAGGDRLSSELGAGMQAVTLAVDVETGLAGHVRPYDAVRIVSAEGASAGEAFLETICERARVLAVGDDATGVQSGSASVTVEVSPGEADAVREAQFAGRVSLVLIAADDALGEVGDDGQGD